MVDKVFDLFSELGATDAQMDFQIVYASGTATHRITRDVTDLVMNCLVGFNIASPIVYDTRQN